MSKKVVSLLLCLLLCLGFVPFASADEQPVEYTSGDYTYTLLPDGSAEITEYKGSAADLSIPAKLDGRTVTSVGDSAFSWCIALTSVIIPNSVISIGEGAFASCTALTSVTIPDSVTSIGANPFEYCKSLETFLISPDHPALAVTDGVLFYKPEKRLVCYPCAFTAKSYSIPQGILSIGDYAFSSCTALTSVIIPDSVISIGEGAFYSCEALTSVSIGNGVTSIGDEAFAYCEALASVIIPDSVTSIGANPFEYCKSLETFLISPDHPALAVIDGVLFYKPEKRLVCYPCAFTAKSYSIPQGILSIGDEAFSSCEALTSVNIPDSVTSIGDYAFASCDALTSVSIPGSVISIGEGAFSWCTALTSVTIPDSVTSIGEGAFYKCKAMTLTVPASSYAEQYAQENSIPYIYPNSSTDWLLG